MTERILCVHNLVLCVWGRGMFPPPLLSLVLDDIPPRLWLFFFLPVQYGLGGGG